MGSGPCPGELDSLGFWLNVCWVKSLLSQQPTKWLPYPYTHRHPFPTILLSHLACLPPAQETGRTTLAPFWHCANICRDVSCMILPTFVYLYTWARSSWKAGNRSLCSWTDQQARPMVNLQWANVSFLFSTLHICLLRSSVSLYSNISEDCHVQLTQSLSCVVCNCMRQHTAWRSTTHLSSSRLCRYRDQTIPYRAEL